MLFGTLLGWLSAFVAFWRLPQGLCVRTQQAPVFIHEPAARVDFSNGTGSVIPCSAHGNPPPSITWITGDGATVLDVPGLRHIRPDGSLVFPPFRTEDFRQDVHARTYRCLATNTVGVAGSRDVAVRGVVQQEYTVEVYDEFVILGNTAVLRCHVPGYVKEFLTVTSWIQDGSFLIPVTSGSGDRYSVFPSGELHVRHVEISDGEKRFQCQTRHRLTGEVTTSATSGRIVVNDTFLVAEEASSNGNESDPFNSILPRITDTRRQVRSREGESVQLPCAAQGHPAPSYHWSRKEASRMQALSTSARVRQTGGTLLIHQAAVQDSGKYVCSVNNTMGSDTAVTDLLITAPLAVRVEPRSQVVDVGNPATLNCTHSGYPILSVEWFHDQRTLRASNRVKFLNRLTLHISAVQKEDAGVYQCYVFNKEDSAQGTTQLTLGEDAPSFVLTFESKETQPGPAVSLRCLASGNPLPQVTWTLDGLPVPEGPRFRMGDYVKSDATVVSYVNISSVLPEDGGTYACTAANEAGSVRHQGALQVHGPPYVRPMRNRTVVAGLALILQCPVGGYPIEEIFWEKDGHRLPFNHRQRVFINGTLALQYLERPTDEGRYTCVARNADGQSASNNLFILITVQPFIEPFNLPKSLHQGQRYTVLCSVTQGDAPVQIQWLKDGRPLTSLRGVHPVGVTEFSSTLVFEAVQPEHRGNYTCRATNAGGEASHHATMVIHVPPRWKVEPETTFVIQGQSLYLDCQAEGFPLPRIRWAKAQGSVPSEFQPISSSSRVHVFENGTLAIQSAEEADAGHFLCQASNGIGQGLSKVVHITVKVAAHFSSEFSAETVRKGDDARLRCEAVGDKPITVEWFKDKQKFDPASDPRYESRDTILSKGMTSEVIIHRADRRDSALFTCMARNTYGTDDTNIQLIMQEPPDPPQDLKATEFSSRTVRLTWTSPYSGNSPISEYILQYKNEQEKWHLRTFNVTVPGGETFSVIKSLLPVTSYNFRVLAINSLGFSEHSSIISIKTAEEAPGGPPLKVKGQPAGSQSLKITWKPPRKDLHFGEIKGYYVGYKVLGSTDTYVYKTLESEKHQDQCHLTNLRRFTKYGVVVQAFNGQGAGPPSDEIIVQTHENDPPKSPLLKLPSSTPSSLRLTWELDKTDQNPVTGFLLQFKKEYGDWEEVKLPGEASHYVISHLQCGTKYQFYLTAFNNIGNGEASEVLKTKTDGMAPVAPDKQSFLHVNLSSVTLRLDAWHDGGCPVTHFSIKYRLQRQKVWTLAGNSVPVTKTYPLPSLIHGSWYQVQVTAHSEAGSTEAEYSFFTPTREKELGLPATVQESQGVPFYLDLNVILPALISFGVVIAVVVLVCIIIRKRSSSESTHAGFYGCANRKRAPPAQESVHLSNMVKNCVSKKGSGVGEAPTLYYPTPYATTDIGLRDEPKMVDGFDKQLAPEEPLYATVKRTPRPPRSDLHIYHYPDDLRGANGDWKPPPTLREEMEEASSPVNRGASRRSKYTPR